MESRKGLHSIVVSSEIKTRGEDQTSPKSINIKPLSKNDKKSSEINVLALSDDPFTSHSATFVDEMENFKHLLKDPGMDTNSERPSFVESSRPTILRESVVYGSKTTTFEL